MKRCLPKYDFPKEFDVTFINNHWLNYEKCIDLFERIIFPYLSQKKKKLQYPSDQYSLVIRDTFKGQDNDAMKELCAKNNFELVIVPHNLTNKFQQLDLTVNQKGKMFISNKFNVSGGTGVTISGSIIFWIVVFLTNLYKKVWCFIFLWSYSTWHKPKICETYFGWTFPHWKSC